MKVSLDEKGTIIINSENTVEVFALTKWYELWKKGETFFLIQTCERANDGSDALDETLKLIEPKNSEGQG